MYNNTINEKALYTIKEAAEILHTTSANVYKLIQGKKLQAIKLGSIKIRREDLDEMMKEVPNDMNNTKTLYTVKEAAEILHTTPAIVYKLIQDKKLQAIKLGSIKIRREDLDEIMKEASTDMNNTNTLYTVKEAAEILHTTPANVYKLIHDKKLQFIKFGSIKIRRENLISFAVEGGC